MLVFSGSVTFSVAVIVFLTAGQFYTSWSCDQDCPTVKNVITATKNITSARETITFVMFL